MCFLFLFLLHIFLFIVNIGRNITKRMNSWAPCKTLLHTFKYLIYIQRFMKNVLRYVYISRLFSFFIYSGIITRFYIFSICCQIQGMIKLVKEKTELFPFFKAWPHITSWAEALWEDPGFTAGIICFSWVFPTRSRSTGL